ncbi:hypothetical protein [Georgenia sp. Z1491]|uniref:hypothetical protein n=1 Tax=Georgenia sp. Z1491 TaxID=3416707 RepID=UPI003CECA2E5
MEQERELEHRRDEEQEQRRDEDEVDDGRAPLGVVGRRVLAIVLGGSTTRDDAPLWSD